METLMAKKIRRTRGASGPFSAPLRKAKLSVGRIRQQEKEKAEAEYPELLAFLNGIKERLKENVATGKRFAFRKSQKEMYRQVYDWDKEGFLSDNQAIIAKFRAAPLRRGANPFTGIVAFCSDRDTKTVSRWSQELDNAFEAEVKPSGLIAFLEKEASSKSKKSKATKPKAKKPKEKRLYWGPRPTP
jgi:hypothetical protein